MASEIEQHVVPLIGGEAGEAVLIEQFSDGHDCVLRCRWRGRSVEDRAGDFFEAFALVRLRLEREGLMPLCWGASLDCYPSGMGRDMGAGLRPYRLRMGQHTGMDDLVDLFATGPGCTPATVEAQRRYWRDWLDGPKSFDEPS